MQFKLTRLGAWVEFGSCPICNEYSRPQPFSVIAALYSDSGTYWGEICFSCYNSSADEIQQKLQRKAQFEAKIAQETAALAQEPVRKPDLTQEFQVYRGHSHE